jgi:guanylate kinase
VSISSSTRKGILFVISGSSGVGKGTINKALLTILDDIKLSISATTRPMRTGEIEGKDYFFVSGEEFTNRLDNQDFLEYAHVYSHWYGTPLQFVVENLRQGIDVLLEIDVQGAMQVKEKMPEGVFVFIQPPSIEDLAHRIKNRGKDSPQSIKDRMAACEQEMDMIRYYDYVVVNDNLEDAVFKVQSIITAERCRVQYYY